MLTFQNEYCGPAAITYVNGKPALVFDKVPALIFVSYDGHSDNDTLLINGRNIYRRKVTIESEAGGFSSYKIDGYAFGDEKDTWE